MACVELTARTRVSINRWRGGILCSGKSAKLRRRAHVQFDPQLCAISLTVRRATPSSLAICSFSLPPTIRSKTSHSRVVSTARRVLCRRGSSRAARCSASYASARRYNSGSISRTESLVCAITVCMYIHSIAVVQIRLVVMPAHAHVAVNRHRTP